MLLDVSSFYCVSAGVLEFGIMTVVRIVSTDKHRGNNPAVFNGEKIDHAIGRAQPKKYLRSSVIGSRNGGGKEVALSRKVVLFR